MSRIDEALTQIASSKSPLPGRTLVDFSLSDYPVEDAVPPPAREFPAVAPLASPTTFQAPAPVRKAIEDRPAPADAMSNRKYASDKLITSSHVSRVAVEQYRRLAAALHEAQEVRGLKRVMVASAAPNDGKTLTAINLALTLSESYGQRVLLVDADLRRPSVNGVFRLSNRHGLSDVLRSSSRAPLPLIEVSPCLSLLLAGRPDSSPLAGLTSGRMKDVLEEASASFDWVIIDTPPVGLLPDAQIVARLADAVLLVVAAGATPYQLVQRAIADVGADRVLGVVLNRAESASTMSHYYESYYINGTGRNRESHG